MYNIHRQHYASRYRPDIDGMRAVAILLVVGFHAFPHAIAGGFTGVDIFFILSGFLISGIILNDLHQSRFSFIGFYAHRINRILPALLAVLLAIALAGWFYLMVDEYKLLGKHIASGSVFMSNFLLRQEGGYFDGAAETKPLLHLWSLSIEEQFYLSWPLLLCLMHARNWNPLYLILSVGIASFVLGLERLGHSQQSGAFYYPASRFWELLLGALIAYAELNASQQLKWIRSKRLIAHLISLSGALLITYGLSITTRDSTFPGWYALPPVLGTSLLLLAGQDAVVNRFILSHPVMIAIGLISYPLYLWHWPLLSLGHLIEGTALSVTLRIALLTASFVLAWATFAFIETPIRSRRDSRVIPLCLLALLAFTGLVGIYIFKTNGLPERLGEKGEYLSYFENILPEWRYFERNRLSDEYRYACNSYDVANYRIGQSTNVPLPVSNSCTQRDLNYIHSMLLWGDSHAQHLYSGLKKYLPANWQVLQVTSSGCAPQIAAKDSSEDYCQHSNWLAMETALKEKPDVIVLAQNVDHKVDKLNEVIAFLRKSGIPRILFVGPTPHWTKPLPKLVAMDLWNNTPARTRVGVDTDTQKLNEKLLHSLTLGLDVSYINLQQFFCNNEGCLIYSGTDRKYGITSYDYGHLTISASELVAKELLVKAITGTAP